MIVTSVIRGKCFIMSLPNELLINIFKNLSVADIKTSYLVCKRWYDIITDNLLLEQIIHTRCNVRSNSWLGERYETAKILSEPLKLYSIYHLFPMNISQDLKSLFTSKAWRVLNVAELKLLPSQFTDLTEYRYAELIMDWVVYNKPSFTTEHCSHYTSRIIQELWDTLREIIFDTHYLSSLKSHLTNNIPGCHSLYIRQTYWTGAVVYRFKPKQIQSFVLFKPVKLKATCIYRDCYKEDDLVITIRLRHGVPVGYAQWG